MRAYGDIFLKLVLFFVSSLIYLNELFFSSVFEYVNLRNSFELTGHELLPEVMIHQIIYKKMSSKINSDHITIKVKVDTFNNRKQLARDKKAGKLLTDPFRFAKSVAYPLYTLCTCSRQPGECG